MFVGWVAAGDEERTWTWILLGLARTAWTFTYRFVVSVGLIALFLYCSVMDSLDLRELCESILSRLYGVRGLYRVSEKGTIVAQLPKIVRSLFSDSLPRAQGLFFLVQSVVVPHRDRREDDTMQDRPEALVR